jgi:quinol-cytochrome oxidoreductase complex cytochrome b subunit
MAGLSLVHLTLLHDTGSSNPLGIDSIGDFIPFYPYFLIKDVFGFFVLLILFSYLIFFMPDLLGHQDNYIKADALVTPPHIVPEWYFLPFYAILRAVPDKLGGFVVMASSIAVVFFIPAINADQSRVTRLFQKNKVFSFNQFVLVFILLGVLGSKPVEWPYNHISPLVTFFYFYFFIKETRVFISPLPTVTRFDPLWLEISGAGWSARLFLSYDFVYCCPLFELLWSTLILFWCIFIVLKYGFVIKWPAFENQLDSLSF